MFGLLQLCGGVVVRLFRSRGFLLIENLALRQQLAVFKRQHRRPKLAAGDELFWVVLRRHWSSWKTALIVVSPDRRFCSAKSSWLTTKYSMSVPVFAAAVDSVNIQSFE